MNRDDESDVAAQRRKTFTERAPAYRNMLFAIVFSLTHDRELAHEISQQAMLNYLSRMDKEHWELEIDNESAYLVRIAKNLVNDGWRAHGKAEFVSFDQQLDDRLLKVLSQLSDSSDVQNQIYLEELLHTLPWKTILRGFSSYHLRLLYLHAVEGLSYEEVAQEVNKDVEVVRYQLQKIYATIRNRIQVIYGKKGWFTSNT